jgi:outer membrane protein
MTRLVLIGLCVIFPLGLHSPAAPALDLLEAYRHAQAHDAKFAAARAGYAAGKEKLSQGQAQLLPTLTLTGNKTQYDASLRYQGTVTFQGGERRYDTNEYELNLIQPLYRPQNLAAYRQGKAQADIAEAQFHASSHDLILRVAQAYFDLLAAKDSLTLVRSQKHAYTAQHEQATARLNAGTAAITEVHEAKARADLSIAQEIAAENEVELHQRALWKITGLDTDAVANVAAEFPLIRPDPITPEPWVEQSQSHNPELQALRDSVRVAELELDRARSGHYPTLDAVASHNNSDSTGSIYVDAASDNRVQSIGLRLQVPLYQGGFASSKIREAAANRDKAREELEDAQREIAVRTRQAFRAVISGVMQVEALSQAVQSSEQALDASRAGRTVGVRSLLDVLNATQQLFTAKREYARARYDYLLAHLKLRGLAGKLTEDDLAWVNQFLVPP